MPRYDALIVGGGCAGLWTAYRLSAIGLRILLVEQADRLAPGPSTRNGGYVHGGGFHAAVIDDEKEASRVAIRCRRGLDEFRLLASEAVVPEQGPVHLLARPGAIAERAATRWRDSDIAFTMRSRAELAGIFPGLRHERVELAATVQDASVDYRILYLALLHRARAFGCEVRLGCTFDRLRRTLVRQGEEKSIETELIIHCTGTASITDGPVAEHWPSIGLWKSHVLTIPKLFQTGLMFMDPGEVSVMPQVGYSIVCQSQDDVQVDAPSYDLMPDRVQGLRDSLARAVDRGGDCAPAGHAHACLKPSVRGNVSARRSVDTHVYRISADEILALPGKATEAPLMATEVLHEIMRSNCPRDIAPRPGDLVDRC